MLFIYLAYGKWRLWYSLKMMDEQAPFFYQNLFWNNSFLFISSQFAIPKSPPATVLHRTSQKIQHIRSSIREFSDLLSLDGLPVSFVTVSWDSSHPGLGTRRGDSSSFCSLRTLPWKYQDKIWFLFSPVGYESSSLRRNKTSYSIIVPLHPNVPCYLVKMDRNTNNKIYKSLLIVIFTA